MGCFLLRLLCVIFIFPKTYSKFQVWIQVYDQSGQSSSLLYEGGTMEITCTIYGCQQDIYLWASKGKGDGYIKLDGGARWQIRREISINSSGLATKYKCVCGEESSSEIVINYALCNPRLVKPKKVCPKANEFCQITKEGSTECKSLTKKSCSYIPDSSRKESDTLLVKPFFPMVCAKHKGNVQKNPENQENGLCYSLINPSSLPPRFLGTNAAECNNEFNVYVCGNNCRIKKQLAMGGWEFTDLKYLSSIAVEFSGSKFYLLNCIAGIGTNITINSETVTLANDSVPHMTKFVEQLKQLSTPVMADITCTGTFGIERVPYFQYRTSLVLFESDKSLKLEISQEKFENMTARITINVTAGKGLYVCIEEDKGSCTPTNDSNAESLTIVTSRIVTFYIGLFASSPKTKYILIHNETVSAGVQPPSTSFATTTTGKSKQRETSFTKRGHEKLNSGFQVNSTAKDSKERSLEFGLSIAVIIAGIIMSISIVVMAYVEIRGNITGQ